MVFAQTELVDALESIPAWAKFGLPGMVIGSLFFTLWMLIRMHNRAVERSEQRQDEIREKDDQRLQLILEQNASLHRETLTTFKAEQHAERQLCREDHQRLEAQQKATDHVVKNLAQTITQRHAVEDERRKSDERRGL